MLLSLLCTVPDVPIHHGQVHVTEGARHQQVVNHLQFRAWWRSIEIHLNINILGICCDSCLEEITFAVKVLAKYSKMKYTLFEAYLSTSGAIHQYTLKWPNFWLNSCHRQVVCIYYLSHWNLELDS